MVALSRNAPDAPSRLPARDVDAKIRDLLHDRGIRDAHPTRDLAAIPGCALEEMLEVPALDVLERGGRIAIEPVRSLRGAHRRRKQDRVRRQHGFSLEDHGALDEVA